MKFDQLIRYNMRNIFLEKSYKKCGEEAIPLSFPKKIKIVEGYQNMLKLRCSPLAFSSYKAFFKK